MAGYPWSSAYLLKFVKRLIGRGNIAEAVTDQSFYDRLSEAQAEVVSEIAAVCPQVLYPNVAYSAIPTLTTTDNQVFTFGSDANGFALRPFGKVGIYPTLQSIPDTPWREGFDYIAESTGIRIPNNRTYSGTLYWRGIAPPGVIDGSNEPALYPEQSRELIAYKAASAFQFEGNRAPESGTYLAAKYNDRFAQWCLTWRTSFRGGGAWGPSYTGLKLALMSGQPSQWSA